jgi:hypothetical protein
MKTSGGFKDTNSELVPRVSCMPMTRLLTLVVMVTLQCWLTSDPSVSVVT